MSLMCRLLCNISEGKLRSGILIATCCKSKNGSFKPLHLCRNQIMSLPKVIIDTDAGLDDAWAIFMALAAHKRKELEVIAITTVQGNTGVQNVNKNVLRILKTADLLEQIPVYSGASKSLVHPWKYESEPFHGHDGFGDANLPDPPPPTSHLQQEHGAVALVNLAMKYSNEIVLAALGPLTNLALAIRLDDSFMSNLSAVYIMGGNTTGEGNITIAGEFNFTCDPEAARVVFEEAKHPIYLTPWEICLYQTALPYTVREEFGSFKTREAELLNKIEAKVNETREFGKWITCDQVAVAWMIDNLKKTKKSKGGSNGDVTESFATSLKHFATIETQGSLTRGQMVIDHMNIMKRSPNLNIINNVNMELFQRYLKMAVSGKF